MARRRSSSGETDGPAGPSGDALRWGYEPPPCGDHAALAGGVVLRVGLLRSTCSIVTAVRAALFTALAWAGWHAPLFVILAGFRGFDAALLPGFFLGMVAGGMVLTHIYNVAGGSIAAAGCWHVADNLASATAAAEGTVAVVTTAIVMIQAAALLVAAYRRSRRHLPSPLLGGRSSTARSDPVTVLPATQVQRRVERPRLGRPERQLW